MTTDAQDAAETVDSDATTDTNLTTAHHATDPGALPLGRMQLIGLMGSDANRRALIRLSSGRVHSVSPGDRIKGNTVVAIDETGLALTRNGKAQTLRMPVG